MENNLPPVNIDDVVYLGKVQRRVGKYTVVRKMQSDGHLTARFEAYDDNVVKLNSYVGGFGHELPRSVSWNGNDEARAKLSFALGKKSRVASSCETAIESSATFLSAVRHEAADNDGFSQGMHSNVRDSTQFVGLFDPTDSRLPWEMMSGGASELRVNGEGRYAPERCPNICWLPLTVGDAADPPQGLFLRQEATHCTVSKISKRHVLTNVSDSQAKSDLLHLAALGFQHVVETLFGCDDRPSKISESKSRLWCSRIFTVPTVGGAVVPAACCVMSTLLGMPLHPCDNFFERCQPAVENDNRCDVALISGGSNIVTTLQMELFLLKCGIQLPCYPIQTASSTEVDGRLWWTRIANVPEAISLAEQIVDFLLSSGAKWPGFMIALLASRVHDLGSLDGDDDAAAQRVFHSLFETPVYRALGTKRAVVHQHRSSSSKHDLKLPRKLMVPMQEEANINNGFDLFGNGLLLDGVAQSMMDSNSIVDAAHINSDVDSIQLEDSADDENVDGNCESSNHWYADAEPAVYFGEVDINNRPHGSGVVFLKPSMGQWSPLFHPTEAPVRFGLFSRGQCLCELTNATPDGVPTTPPLPTLSTTVSRDRRRLQMSFSQPATETRMAATPLCISRASNSIVRPVIILDTYRGATEAPVASMQQTSAAITETPSAARIKPGVRAEAFVCEYLASHGLNPGKDFSMVMLDGSRGCDIDLHVPNAVGERHNIHMEIKTVPFREQHHIIKVRLSYNQRAALHRDPSRFILLIVAHSYRTDSFHVMGYFRGCDVLTALRDQRC